MKQSNKTVSTKVIFIYLVIFYVWWAFFELGLPNLFAGVLNQNPWGSLIKLVTWIVPVIFLLKKFSGSVVISLREMFTNKFKLLPYLLILLAVLAYAGLSIFAKHATFSFNLDAFATAITAGIAEELVFRGWLLNSLIPKLGVNWALAVSSLLFLIIHFPIWLRKGVFLAQFTSLGFLTILAFAVVVALTFIKSKNILVPMVIHALYDLLLMLF